MENELLLFPTFQTVTHSSMAGSWEAKTYTLLCDITSKSRKRRACWGINPEGKEDAVEESKKVAQGLMCPGN